MGNDAFNVSSNLLDRLWRKVRGIELGTSPITLTGDTNGDSNNNTVTKIQNKTIDESLNDDGILSFNFNGNSFYNNNPTNQGLILSSNANIEGVKCNWIYEITFYSTSSSNQLSTVPIDPYINAYIEVNSGTGNNFSLDNANLYNGKTMIIKNNNIVIGNLNIQNGGSIINALSFGEVGIYICDGTNWVCISKSLV